MALADEVIDEQAADVLISWEVYVATATANAVDEAVGVLGYTAQALRRAYEAVVAVVGEAAAAAWQVGRAIAAQAWQLVSSQRPGRRPSRRRAVRRPQTTTVGVDYEQQADTVVATGVRRLDSGEDPQQVIADTKAAFARLGTSTVNQAAAAGSEQAAALLGAPGVVWVAERDACVHCLGLAGRVSATGRFDGAHTFGDKPLAWRGFTGRPPRHPNCRCRVIPWAGENDLVPAALRREAERSIVRGWSLPSESEAARLRAAERLLRRGTGLPRSVARYGRDAVRAGRFPRGRDVPQFQSQAA